MASLRIEVGSRSMVERCWAEAVVYVAEWVGADWPVSLRLGGGIVPRGHGKVA